MMTPPGRERAKTCTLERSMVLTLVMGAGERSLHHSPSPVLRLILHAQWARGRGREKGLHPVLP